MKATQHGTATPNKHQEIPGTPQGPVESWSIPRLIGFVPGSTRRTWHVVLIPALLEAGALRRRGRRWYGRATDIEAALLAGPDGISSTTGRRS